MEFGLCSHTRHNTYRQSSQTIDKPQPRLGYVCLSVCMFVCMQCIAWGNKQCQLLLLLPHSSNVNRYSQTHLHRLMCKRQVSATDHLELDPHAQCTHTHTHLYNCSHFCFSTYQLHLTSTTKDTALQRKFFLKRVLHFGTKYAHLIRRVKNASTCGKICDVWIFAKFVIYNAAIVRLP